jgi:hypothetical protein
MSFLSGRTSLTTVQTGDIAANAIDSTLTKDALIADYTEVTIAAGDSLLLGDVGDSGNTKRDTVQGLLDLAGGAWTFLSTVTASGASSADFTSGIDSTYSTYAIIGQGIVPGTDNQDIWCRLGNGGAFDSGSSDYGWIVFGGQSDNTGNVDLHHDADDSDAQIYLVGDDTTSTALGTASGELFDFTLFLFDPSNTGRNTSISIDATYKSQVTTNATRRGSGWRLEAAAHDRIQFLMASGNITGVFRLYGIAAS